MQKLWHRCMTIKNAGGRISETNTANSEAIAQWFTESSKTFIIIVFYVSWMRLWDVSGANIDAQHSDPTLMYMQNEGIAPTILSPSAHIHRSSVVFVGSLPPTSLRLLPSVLSPYPLINQVVHFHPRKKNELWSSFPSSLSLSRNKTCPLFSSCPPQQTKHTSSRHTILCECIYLNAPCPASVVVFYGVLQSEVNTPNLICLFCFIFQGGTFPPHISWEIGEKQREGGRRGGGRESDQKHGVLYSTWSCFIISWSSSDTSYDGVLDPGEVCV